MISINGKTYKNANNITITDGKVILDGVVQNVEDSPTINISIEGDVQTLSVDSCEVIHVAGDTYSLNTVNGKVIALGNVNDIETINGNVKCNGDILGNVKTVNGNVR